ncbi:MAG: organic solvent tolerance protein OstA [Sporomusaceae bacterium]|jgi:lipopolysaccharide export system protein LptA|nr:organic solvent tolerance protein OstA [Sporomusaceae bacterium]
MNKKKKLICKVLVGLAAVFSLTTQVYSPPAFSAAAPVQLEADTITYSNKDGLVEATGNVKITQNDSVITAGWVEYNTNTSEGRMRGGVRAVMADASLTADEVRSVGGNEQIFAVGNVVLIKGENTLTGDEIEYHPAAEYVLVPAPARIETKDAVMTANRLEAFLREERAVGTGNVHIVSAARNLDATANQATYYGLPQEAAKVILTGNVRVVEGVNILTGENLTVALNEKEIEANGGRPRLVFTPQEQ